MSSDKRTVSTDALETLGMIHTREEKRDAIHLAVIPATAGCRLEAGAHIGLQDGKAFHSSVCDVALGIVDPFLPRAVQAGERFWLVIYPRVITSLRHVWTHPELDDEVAKPLVSPQTIEDLRQLESRQWLERRADSLGISYEEILAAGTDRDYPGCFGNDIDGEREIEPEFWEHIQRVTGDVAPANIRPGYFRCAC